MICVCSVWFGVPYGTVIYYVLSARVALWSARSNKIHNTCIYRSLYFFQGFGDQHTLITIWATVPYIFGRIGERKKFLEFS